MMLLVSSTTKIERRERRQDRIMVGASGNGVSWSAYQHYNDSARKWFPENYAKMPYMDHNQGFARNGCKPTVRSAGNDRGK
jgi:hypothetical protein